MPSSVITVESPLPICASYRILLVPTSETLYFLTKEDLLDHIRVKHLLLCTLGTPFRAVLYDVLISCYCSY